MNNNTKRIIEQLKKGLDTTNIQLADALSDIDSDPSGGGYTFKDYTEAGGTKTQEEFNPAFVNSVDNSDLFFILPEGTKFPYTLTEDDKSNLAKALFIIATSSPSGRTAVYAKTLNVINGYQGYWINSENAGNSAVLGISDKVISAPSFINFGLVTYTEQTLTPQQQEQARKNIGAASEEVIGDINSILDTINGEVI